MDDKRGKGFSVENKKRSGKYLIRQLLTYVLGMFFIAFGSSLAVVGNLGISAVVSVPYILSLITAGNFGRLTTLVFLIYIAIQVLILRKETKPTTLIQILPSFLYGYFINLSGEIVRFLQPESYFERLIILLTSILIMALGVYLYLSPKLLPMPAEGIIVVLAEKTGRPFSTMKGIFDSGSVGLATLLILVFTGRLQGVREGTILAALSIGPISGIYRKILQSKLDVFLFGEGSPEN